MGIVGILLLAGFSFFIVKERGKSEVERKKSDDLLLNILPAEVAEELKANGATTAKHFDNAERRPGKLPVPNRKSLLAPDRRTNVRARGEHLRTTSSPIEADLPITAPRNEILP